MGQGLTGKKILIVDDEADLVEVLKLRLEVTGCLVRTASDGAACLADVKQERPDLILLDVMMAGMDGYQVCRILKFDALFKDIPIILLTARTQERDQKIGKDVGADDYVTKPFDDADLLARMERLL